MLPAYRETAMDWGHHSHYACAMILSRNVDWTIGTAISCATEYLAGHNLVYGHGTAAAADDAAWLILEAAGLSPLQEPDYQQVLTTQILDQAETFLRLRAEEKLPAAYIVGRMWFAGLEFFVDSRVLVPRSPLSEFLTGDCFGMLDTAAVTRVLDLCTGGGCIAVTCAYAFAQAEVDALDISAEALEVAAVNIAKHGLEQRVHPSRGDLFETASGPYDLIISNPPYVDKTDISQMSDEFRHEPLLGLEAGDDGLDIARRILAGSKALLAEGGLLVCEVGNSAQALAEAYPELPFHWLEFDYGGEGIFSLYRDELPD